MVTGKDFSSKKSYAAFVTTYEQCIFSKPAPLSPEEFFDIQVAILASEELAKPADAKPFCGRLPRTGLFLFVPSPPKELDLKDLMRKVELNDSRGVNYLDVDGLDDLAEFPRSASLLTDIEDGRARLDVENDISCENIKNDARHPYNVWRGIIHAIVFPWVLRHHYLDLVGSRYRKNSRPYLYVNASNPAPALSYSIWKTGPDPKWGAPSCGEVLLP